MAHLKLAKLPDRKPVKFTITVRPELARALEFMSILYRDTYGEAEPIEELIPYVVQTFLDNDRNFAKAWKRRQEDGTSVSAAEPVRRMRRRRSAVKANGDDISNPSAGGA